MRQLKIPTTTTMLKIFLMLRTTQLLLHPCDLTEAVSTCPVCSVCSVDLSQGSNQAAPYWKLFNLLRDARPSGKRVLFFPCTIHHGRWEKAAGQLVPGGKHPRAAASALKPCWAKGSEFPAINKRFVQYKSAGKASSFTVEVHAGSRRWTRSSSFCLKNTGT